MKGHTGLEGKMSKLTVFVQMALVAASSLSVGAGATVLDGCWRTASVEFHRSNGAVERSNQACIRHYDGNKFVTSCNAGAEVTVYGFQLGNGSYIYQPIKRFVGGAPAQPTSTDSTVAQFQRSGTSLAISISRPNVRVEQRLVQAPPRECEQLIAYVKDDRSVGVAQFPASTSRAPISSSTVPTSDGKYGAPDLLGFKVGMAPVSVLESRLSELLREGYKIQRSSGQSSDVAQMITASRARFVQGPRPHYTTQASYVRLFVDSDSELRGVVRGETFVQMPFISDFVGALRSKLPLPPWTVSWLENVGQTPQLFEKSDREPFWAVANGRTVRIRDCYSSTDRQIVDSSEYRLPAINERGGAYDFQTYHFAFLTSAFQNLKPGYCQYAVGILAKTPIYGDNQKEVVAEYAVTIIDLQKSAVSGAAALQRQRNAVQEDINRKRASSSKPSL